MRTFFIWKLVPEQTGPTGPWQYQSLCRVATEAEAIETGRMRHGLNGTYQVYAGI